MEFAGDTTPPPLTTANLLKKIATILSAIACLLLVFTTIIFAITTLIFFQFPRFQVKWASISLHNVSSFNNDNTNNFMTAKWNLSISVRNPSKAYAIKYHDFGIKLNFFARYSTTLANYSSPTRVVPGFLQPRGNTTNLDNVLLNATLPYYAIPTVEDLDFEVIIKVKFKSSSVIFNLKLFNMDAFCNDMKIGIFSNNATYGYFIGTPKSCSSLFRGRKIN